MKTYLLFLLTIAVVTAAPTTAMTSHDIDIALLKEITDNVNYLNTNLNNKAKTTIVPEVIKKHCTLQSFCETGKLLEAFKAEDFGLQEKEWLLPRKLVAYSRNIQCKSPPDASYDTVEFHQLLVNIRRCAQQKTAGH